MLIDLRMNARFHEAELDEKLKLNEAIHAMMEMLIQDLKDSDLTNDTHSQDSRRKTSPPPASVSCRSYFKGRRKNRLDRSRKDSFRDLYDKLLTETESKTFSRTVLFKQSDLAKRIDQDVLPTYTATVLSDPTQQKKPIINEVSSEPRARQYPSLQLPQRLKIFFSYAWGENDKLVEKVAERLKEAGFEIIRDKKQPGGTDLLDFMQKGIRESDVCLMFIGSEYKKKADQKSDGVGLEVSIIAEELADNPSTIKFIPILAEGSFKSSLPRCIRYRKGYDLLSDYDNGMSTLLEDLLSRPLAIAS